jgi:hypothetical protein
MADQTTKDGVEMESNPVLDLALEWENDAQKLNDFAERMAENRHEQSALRGAAERVQRMAGRLRIVAGAAIKPTPLLDLAVAWEIDARKLNDFAERMAENAPEREVLRGSAARAQLLSDRLRSVARVAASATPFWNWDWLWPGKDAARKLNSVSPTTDQEPL